MNIEDFQKIDLRVGLIVDASPVDGSEKLLKLSIDLGEKGVDGQPVFRQILSGIAKTYSVDSLRGLQVVVIANLEPRVMMGLTSYGMVLAASSEAGVPVLLTVHNPVEPGSRIT